MPVEGDSRGQLPRGTLALLERLHPIPRQSWHKLARRYKVRWLVEIAVRYRDLAMWGRTDACGICGAFADGGDYEFDHIIPLSRGGKHAIENIQFTHTRCNRSKGAT